MNAPMKIPFHRPFIENEEFEAVVATLKGGWLTTGHAVKEFERLFSEYTGARHAIAVNSCTAAMHLALAALGVGPGDLVVTTPYTFVATAEAIQYLGAKPIFVDIRESDFNLDPEKLADELGSREKEGTLGQLRGVLPVHIAGQPCDIFTIKALAQEHSLFVVEDAAHCLEGRVERRARTQNAGATSRKDDQVKVGTIGDATCFSFYATKNITTAEGGMVTCEDDALAERIRILSLHGMSRDAWKRYMREGSWYYEIVAQGYKYNMPDVLGALGVVQLRKAERMHALRQRYAEMLLTALADLEEVILPQPMAGKRHAWHLFILRLRLERLNISRNEFIKKLFERGIQASVHFIPLHLHPYFQQTYGLRRGDFPIAEKVYDSAISLPLYPALREDEVRYIAQTVRALVREHARTR